MTLFQIAVISVGAVIVAGLIAGRFARSALRRKHPAPGQLVDMGGHRLHLRRSGHGAPTLVLEAGLGLDASLSWSPLLPALAELTHVVAYDRSGYGWSDPSRGERTAGVMVRELRQLLARAGEKPPFVLMGHSFGALIVRLYAYQHPDEVVGMVLLDPAHEDQMERFPKQIVGAVDLKKMVRLMKPMKYVFGAGIPALRPQVVPLDAPLPPDVLAQAKGLMASGPNGFATFIAEQEGLEVSQSQVRAARRNGLGNIPLVVLGNGIPAPLPPNIKASEEVRQRYEEEWEEMSRELAEASSQGQYMKVPDATHYVHLDAPDVVVTAVKDVLSAIPTARASVGIA